MKADLPKKSYAIADKKYAFNVEEPIMEGLALAKNKLTNNLKNGSEEKISSCVQCARLTSKKAKDAIT